MSKLVDEIINNNKLISDQIEIDELRIILSEQERLISNNIEGDIVEFGCYSGTTSLFITRLLRASGSIKKLWVYDSFDGLPEKTSQDLSPLGDLFVRGQLRYTKADFIHNFRKANLPIPIITKKWFHQVEDSELPEKICMAFLDGDYYKSIRASINLVRDRIQDGGLVIVDDYDNPSLPGAAKAVLESSLEPYKVCKSLALIRF